jgi:hypothetical protein
MTQSEIKLAAVAAYWKKVLTHNEDDLNYVMVKEDYISSVVDVLEYASIDFEESDVDVITEYIEKHF